jgi:hypothetical protein
MRRGTHGSKDDIGGKMDILGICHVDTRDSICRGSMGKEGMTWYQEMGEGQSAPLGRAESWGKR